MNQHTRTWQERRQDWALGRDLERKDAEIERLRALLREARQYVDDAGIDEDPETQGNSVVLLGEIDAVLSAGEASHKRGET